MTNSDASIYYGTVVSSSYALGSTTIVVSPVILKPVPLRTIVSPICWLSGIIEVIVGSLAIIGYLTKVQLLYYSFSGFTSMAFHTAILFVLIGISLILIGKEKKISLNKKQWNYKQN